MSGNQRGIPVTAMVLALLAGWSVLRLLRADRRWPWRVIDLCMPPEHTGRSGGPDGAPPRAPLRVPPPSRLPSPSRLPPRSTGRRHRGGVRASTPTRPRRGATARATEGLERDLPAVIDLLRLAVSAGHSLHTAVVAVAATGSGPAAAALAQAVDGFERGGRLVDELERLPARVGPAIRPLTTTLAVAASSGSPLAPALQRLADVERRRLRRRTEERVRRLPVLLLAPLIGLILPAFVLLTVVPVGIITARVGLEPMSSTPFPSAADTRNPP